MARHPEGWKLRKPKGRKTYQVYFRINGIRDERSTGTGDPFEAQKAAERIYADAVQRGGPQKVRVVQRGAAQPLDELIALWLATDSTLDADTAKVWETYGRHWLAHWPTLVDVTDVTCVDYMHARLRKVQGVTVRKELGALRRFLGWCKDRAHLPRAVVVPGVPTKTTGTKDARKTKAGAAIRHRQSAPELSPEQLRAFLAALPEWSKSKKLKVQFPIRARFVVQYETGLRPSTISALRVPEHYTRGATHLTITPEIDKVRWGRTVPLSDVARDALESVCPPKGGLLFGGHDYREHVAAAAAAALPKALAAVFAGAHTRSARTTHLLEASGNLAGVQFLVGHKQGTTTAGYMRPSQRAAEAALGNAFGGRSPNTMDADPTKQETPTSEKARASV